MQQFDICLLKSTRIPVQKIIILQHDRFEELKTRIVAPLIPRRLIDPASGLYPVLTVDDAEYVIAFNQLSTVAIGQVGPVVASAKDRHSDFIAAIDLMFTGY